MLELAVSVLYNTALLCHMKAVSGGQTHILQRGIRFYTAARDMLLEFWRHGMGATNLLLTMAIFNNLAHAHYTQGKLSLAFEAFEDAKCAVAVVAWADEDMDALDSDIMLSLLVGTSASFAIAPAA